MVLILKKIIIAIAGIILIGFIMGKLVLESAVENYFKPKEMSYGQIQKDIDALSRNHFDGQLMNLIDGIKAQRGGGRDRHDFYLLKINNDVAPQEVLRVLKNMEQRTYNHKKDQTVRTKFDVSEGAHPRLVLVGGAYPEWWPKEKSEDLEILDNQRKCCFCSYKFILERSTRQIYIEVFCP